MGLKEILLSGVLGVSLMGCASSPCKHCNSLDIPACNYLAPMVKQGGEGSINPEKVYNWWDDERKDENGENSENTNYRRRR
jgi:hypothetical protein